MAARDVEAVKTGDDELLTVLHTDNDDAAIAFEVTGIHDFAIDRALHGAGRLDDEGDAGLALA